MSYNKSVIFQDTQELPQQFFKEAEQEGVQHPKYNAATGILEITETTNNESPVVSNTVTKEELSFRRKYEKTNNGYKMPGYGGHIPTAKEAYGLSANSVRFMDHITTNYLQDIEEDPNFNKTTTNRSVTKNFERFKVPIVKEKCEGLKSLDNSEMKQVWQTRMQGTLKQVEKASKERLQTQKLDPKLVATYASAGYEGHVPNYGGELRYQPSSLERGKGRHPVQFKI